MKTLSALFALFLAPTAAHAVPALDTLAPQLEPLRPFIGKTWRSVPATPDAKQQVVDIQVWQRALNGQAVRLLHSINDGIYGGETMIMWDASKKSLVYFYFTTDGSYTNGTLAYENGVFEGHETVIGDTDGITEVKWTTMILPDGREHTKAQYLKKGEWVPGHEFYYVEDPSAKVLFK